MEVKTYRAKSMQDALRLVRDDLGSAAAVLHTREVGGNPLLRWIPGLPRIEVTASVDVSVPSRVTNRIRVPGENPPRALDSAAPVSPRPAAGHPVSDEVNGRLTDLQSMVEKLCRQSGGHSHRDLPEALFRIYTDLIEVEVNEDLARELVERVHRETPVEELDDSVLVKARIARMIEAEISVSGPVVSTPGQRRLVALVGPTGVGKTTTIAKLAANFRLREKRNVGLITVDTYRIAAVEQLRTYADIIDLPMQVVSTPREMREAVARMSDLDLILMDTAGRSPKDELQLRELKSFLSEAAADEVHLVLSSVCSAATLERTAARFADVGTTALILTKLDEASSYGNLLPVLRSSHLPLSYLTDGQNVPDDIQAADSRRLAGLILDLDAAGAR